MWQPCFGQIFNFNASDHLLCLQLILSQFGFWLLLYCLYLVDMWQIYWFSEAANSHSA